MAEKRLIDANAFVEKLESDFKKVFTNAGQKVKPEDYYITRKSVYDADLFKAEVDSFCDMVNCQPTVDAVEVVRCKDCDYFTEHNDVRTGRPLGYGECHRYMGLLFRDEDFCSYGESRTDG